MMEATFNPREKTTVTVGGGVSPEVVEAVQIVFGMKKPICKHCGNESVSVFATFGHPEGPKVKIICSECRHVETNYMEE